MNVKIEYAGNERKFIKRLIEFLKIMINDFAKGSKSLPTSDPQLSFFCHFLE